MQRKSQSKCRNGRICFNDGGVDLLVAQWEVDEMSSFDLAVSMPSRCRDVALDGGPGRGSLETYGLTGAMTGG
jgi:hypothetical protein